MKNKKISAPVHLLFLLALLFNLAGTSTPSPAQAVVVTANPILFVTQFPIREDFTTIGAVFGNHKSGLQDVGRGGDLWIRYGDGTLKNLTQTAGYGSTGANGFQDHNAIAVRDPSVYWDGTKALFSMVIGAPDLNERYLWEDYYWQIYEVTGLGQNQTPLITKVPNQPANFNNITPIYGTDDRIIFTTDRPRNGAAHLYPQLDEYEEAPTVSGLWSLDPVTGDLFMMNHAPSGDFTPSIDSFGRVIFTQWDHLQRDQQADADKFDGADYGTFNWSNESAGAVALNDRTEIFPEPRAEEEAAGTNLTSHTFNHFLPWQINEDGTSPETINHIGRHELVGYIPNSFTDDPNIEEYYGQVSRFNQNEIENFLQIKESPFSPGTYFGVDALEFGTHASGQVISMTAPPGLDADHISITYVTHRDTQGLTATANNSGHYRDPLPMADGTLISAHTTQTAYETNSGLSIYAFRLKTLTLSGNGYYTANQFLTAGISKTISYWDPDTMVNFSGTMWELQPVEVRARTKPAKLTSNLGAPEQQVFAAAGVDVAAFQTYMRDNDLALIVSHNVTTRDDFDFVQPLNLNIPNGVQSIDQPGKVYDVKFLQLFQADQIRGIGGTQAPREGRRVLAQLLHDAKVAKVQPPNPNGPASSVVLGLDGSMAAFVPSRRAMTWQLTNPNGVGVVRERVWLTFQPGEIRVCGSCHGVNDKDQAGNPAPLNQPQALLNLLQHWKTVNGNNGLSITSITRANPNPANTASVNFTVAFSDSVTGVDISDFNLTTSGVAGAAVSSVSGSDDVYTVKVNTGSGNGTIRLNIVSSPTIFDLAANPLSGPFTTGETYTINKTLTYSSQSATDGWILESSENSNLGGTMNSSATTFNLGDDAAKKQYRAILSFNTAGLPDTAVVTKATLKLKFSAVVGGGNPLTTFQGFMASIINGTFGLPALELTDFNAAAIKTVGPLSPALSSNFYSLNLGAPDAYINKLTSNSGITEIRLRFKLDDNNDAIANYLSLFSGNALTAADRPKLIIQYYVP